LLVYLPIVQAESRRAPLFIFRQWLARMLILRPIPALIVGDSSEQTLLPKPGVGNFGDWFAGLVADYPRAYSKIEAYLKEIMPDLNDIQNPLVGKGARNLEVQFVKNGASLEVDFEDISDGEKIFMICSVVLAASEAYGPLLCFWDEPDNYLALDEVGHFVMALRKAFKSGGQFIATSHNPEAIRGFSDENTLYLQRKNHFEPTVVRPINQLQIHGDLVNALIRGDVEP
ncbi:MAG: AAA family ATPase, partial [Blastocatellia bacterium]